MTQEQADLGVVGRVDSGGKALLVRPQVLNPEFAEPGMQRVPAAMRAVVRRGQVAVPPVALRHPARGDAELGGRSRLDEGQVLHVIGRVVHRPLAEHAAIPDEVGQQAEPVLGPAKAGTHRLRGVPRDGQTAADGQLVQGDPAAQGEELVVARGLDLAAGGQPQAVDLFGPGREHVGHGGRDQPVPLVERPYQDAVPAVPQQLTKRHRCPGVRAEQGSVLGHAA